MNRLLRNWTLGPLSGSQSWTPLKISSKVLFWGKVSEVTGGQMPNKITGATDFISVSGSPATYQVPNTAPYIAADTDYIWFKSDATQRTITTAELIGYDFVKTLVKYDSVSSYVIREIVILKAGETLTVAEMNLMRDYMQLSIWWDNTLSEYGELKGNRGVGKNVWTAESVMPSTFTNSDVFAWLTADDNATITQVGGLVSKWADKNGRGNDLNQVGADNIKPVLANSEITIDGVRQYADMGAKTLNQPVTVYIVGTQKVWNNGGRIFDGLLNSDTGYLVQLISSPRIYSGSNPGGAFVGPLNLVVNEKHLITVVIDGVNSSIQIDNGTPVTGTVGTGNMGGFSIGRNWGAYAGFNYNEILVRKLNDTSPVKASIKEWLKFKHNTP
jgi:hypothetical protein